ncbi:hypothetical protein HAX54_041376 [Datura stramonium]|uniref:NAC domain-containing protein n=1 Tax=Datura stramonium TaxID=4076 RepID=A0ABS8VP18_DATST|nr:hypothetical protein [Datura stramonium]
MDHQANKGRPMGYRFHPTNKELIKYLLGFARDEPLPDQYQLMQLKKEKPTWKRVSRTVGKGTWKPQGKGKEVFDDKGRLMGFVKSLKYIPADKSSNKVNGQWLMTEYSLYDGYNVKDIKKKGFVICKIKKKEKAGDDKEIEGVNDENMEDAEEFINSVLNQEDDHQENNNNNVEYIEGEEVGEHVLAMLGCDDDDVAVEENNKDVEEYTMNSAKENNNVEYIEGEEVGEHIVAALQDFDLDSIDFVL